MIVQLQYGSIASQTGFSSLARICYLLQCLIKAQHGNVTLSDQIPASGTYMIRADPGQTPQNTASDQGLHCLLTGISLQSTIKVNIVNRMHQTTNGLIQMTRMP